MARPLRSKRLAMKSGENENVVKINSKKTGTKKSDAIKEVMESEDRSDDAVKVESAVVVERTSHSAKGNLCVGRTTVNAMQSPVLRDRTNLPCEGLKVDVLIKKGADNDDDAKKTTNSTRKTKQSAKTGTTGEREDDNTETRNFIRAGRKNTQAKVQIEKVSSSATIDNSENIKKTETKQSLVTGGRKIIRRAASRKITITKSNEIVESENKSSLRDIPENKIGESESIPTDENTRTAGRRVVKRVQTKKPPIKLDKPKNRQENEKESKLEKVPGKKSIKTGIRTSIPGNRVTKRFSSKTKMPQNEFTENEEIEKNSQKRSSRTKVDEKNGKSSEQTSEKNRFFTSKPAVESEGRNSPVKKTVNAKRRNVGTRQKVRMSTSFRMRQMTLSESFANHSGRKFLRPRQSARNYCEDTIIKKKRSSNDSNTDNIDRNKPTEKKIGPIYKTVEWLDDSVDDRNKIYEFQFDSNDSREKQRKKTRKRVVRRKVPRKKVNPTKPSEKKEANSEPTENTKTLANDVVKGNVAVEKRNGVNKDSAESNGTTRLPEMEFVASSSEVMKTDEVPVGEKIVSVTPTVKKAAPRVIEKSVSKPTVVRWRELHGEQRISLTLTPQLTKSSETNSRLLELKNGSKSSCLQYKTMMNHALLNKSISPITKAMENFDPGSPWRPPTFPVQQFFRIKNMVQSTPQLRNFASILEKASLAKDKPGTVTNQTSKQNEKNENVPQNLNNASSKQQTTLSKSPRKFGTEVSNINNPAGFTARILKENNEARQNVISSQKLGTEVSNVSNAPGIAARMLKENNEARQNVIASQKLGTEVSNVSNAPGIAARMLKENNAERQNIIPSQKLGTEVSNVNNAPGISARILKENNEARQNVIASQKLGTVVSNVGNAPGISARMLKENNAARQNVIASQKLGTEVSNVNNAPEITARILKENNEPKQNIISPQKSAIESRVTNTSYSAISNNELPSMNSFNDTIDDKENYTPARPSPRKSPYKTLRLSPYKSPKKFVSKQKPSRVSTNVSPPSKENIEPQTGPSTSESLNVLNDSKILVQSNLNNFLNLEEMPKSTRIVTPHGIFNDAHSTPIPGKPMSRLKKISSIENAFGFDESDELEIEVSPIKPAGPMRLPIEGIRKHFLPILKNRKLAEARLVEKKDAEGNEVRHDDQAEKKKLSNKRKIIDPVDFIDTFDVLEQQAETNDDNIEKIALFEDVEPVHFKQAPRYSYKRKHAGDLNFTDDENENDSSTIEHRQTKKRKMNKVERERQKQMASWAKDLNQTFEEIEHFDLVVE